MQKGSFRWMKSLNKSIILNKIRTDGPISRAQIAKDIKLTPPTVSSNVKELIEQGIVKESELGESLGGRKPKMLLINDKAFYIIGVDAGSQAITCVLSDLSGKVLRRTSSKLSPPLKNGQFLESLKMCIHTVLGDMPLIMDHLIGIGVAMHGVVNVETGTSLIAPNLGLTNIPIQEALEREFNVSVRVENDVRAMALGESWFGDHGKVGSMLVVNLGRGVGAGLVIDGKLYHGAHDIAGEIGHMMVDPRGCLCTCGNYGCLQAFVSGPAIADQANERLKENITTPLTGGTVYALAKEGRTECIEVLQASGRMIGIGLTNLIHIINPQKIVLGGAVMKSSEFILPEVMREIKARALTADAKQTEVAVTKLGDDATIIGAVSLLLVDLFAPN